MQGEKTNSEKLFKVSLSFLSNEIRWMLIFLFLLLGGCRSTFWLHRDRINIDDFENVKASTESNIQEIFDKARQKFSSGDDQYKMNEGLYVIRFKRENEASYDVLFIFTSRVRGFAGGYYYTPSGKLPLRAPEYGVICSRHIDDLWYAFNTVDSVNEPNPKDCPEDVQYQ